MSGLLDEIRNAGRETSRACAVKRIMEKLERADQDDLERALGDESISAAAISRALAARGHKINQDGARVRAHRRGECSCGDA